MTVQAVSVEPVRRTVTVGRPLDAAFRLFTAEMSTWWPFPTHSIGGEETVAAVLEPHEGGRLYERLRDGTEHDWADVVAWDPPNRFVLAWRVNPERRTEVEVRFTAVGDATRVELEHRGWERLRVEAAAARESYRTGWEQVLERYVAAA
jgi:uncharacterized protein YndB with AHSA1/START domain